MRKLSITTDIAAPAERVWDIMSNVDRWHEWTPSITSVKRFGDPVFAVGRWALVRQPKFPPTFWKVTALQPGTSFTWVATGIGFRTIGWHHVEPTSTGSRATLSVEFQGMLGGLFGRLTENVTRRYLEFEAHGLKNRSENPDFRSDRPHP